MVGPRPPLRVVLVGWGAIATTVAAMMVDDPVEIVGVGVRDRQSVRSALPEGATPLFGPDELAAVRPAVVAEAAGRASVGPWGRAALSAGAELIVSSVSAFADVALLAELRALAAANGTKLRISPGALAGIDALAAARVLGIDTVRHRIVKPPRAWAGTPAEDLCDLDGLLTPAEFFTASATETADAFPKNANVAMTTALAGIGPEATTITLVADPNAATNRHEIAAEGPFGTLDVTIANQPLPANPKTSAMAALALVRALRNQVSPIVI